MENQEGGEHEMVETVTDQVDAVWKDSEGRTAVGLRRHAQCFFLEDDRKGHGRSADILHRAQAAEEPVRMRFAKPGGLIVFVDWVNLPGTA